MEFSQQKCALVVAHPGHELLVYGWMKSHAPRVFVFSDGSGREGGGRIHCSEEVVKAAGAQPGDVFGPLRDRMIYDAVLNGNHELFLQLAADLKDAWIRDEVDTILSDAYERRILGHDVCRLVVGAAIHAFTEATGRTVENFAYPIGGYYGNRPPSCAASPVELSLDDATFDEKHKVARNYPDPVIQHEIDVFTEKMGMDGVRTERIFRVEDRTGFDDDEPDSPLYEKHGEEQVKAGHYPETIRYAEHVKPLARALPDGVGG